MKERIEKKEEKKNIKIRNRYNRDAKQSIFFLMVLFGVIFALLLSNIFIIQATKTFEKTNLSVEEKKILEGRGPTTLLGNRGNIYDRSGQALTAIETSYKLSAIVDKSYVNNKGKKLYVTDIERAARELSKIIDMDEEAIYKKLNKKNAFQVEFGSAGKALTPSQKEEIEALKLPGFQFEMNKKRTYPQNEFLTQTLGFTSNVVNKESGSVDIVGQMGAEKYYDKELSGKNGRQVIQRNAQGIPYDFKPTVLVKPKDGADVFLTIDSGIQRMLEDTMNSVEETFNSKLGFIVAMDAKTGEVLGVSTTPDNKMSKGNKDIIYTNTVLDSLYEPGSTMKSLTVSSAIDTGKWNGNATYMSGKYYVNGKKSQSIGEWNDTGWGQITFNEGYKYSSNVAMSKTVDTIGYKTLSDYYHRFRLDEPLDVGLPTTRNTILFPSDFSYYTASFGQGVTVTALQMMRMYTAFANDGVIVEPYLVDRVVYPGKDGKIINYGRRTSGRAIKKETAAEMRTLMLDIANNKKYSGGYGSSKVQIYGKTGTSQVVENKKYSDTTVLTSFMGTAPYNNPDVILYMGVMTHKSPLNHVQLSKLYVPLMEKIISYRDTTKTKTAVLSEATMTMPDVVGMSLKKVQEKGIFTGRNLVTLGAGEIQYQYPYATLEIAQGQTIVLVGKEGPYVFPDLTGYSLLEARLIADALNLKFTYQGKGFVKTQNIKPGTTLTSEKTVNVRLE